MIKLLDYIKLFCFKVGLKDKPTKIKMHKGDIPLIGGLLFLSILLIINFFVSINIYSNIYLLILLSLIGIWDDIKNLNPNFKFLITFVCLLIIISIDKSLQIQIINFKHFDDIYLVNEKILKIFVPTICLLLLLNAFNMADGINGLAGTIFLSWSTYLLFKFSTLLELILPFTIGSIFFLYLNLNKKCFLGDGGNYFLSMLVGSITIKLNNTELGLLVAEEIFLLFLIPGIDMLRLFILRIKKNKNPFYGDRYHLHHYLIKKYSLKKSLLIYLSLINTPLYIYIFSEINLIVLILSSLLVYFFLIRLLVFK